jgi:peroxiredoxin
MTPMIRLILKPVLLLLFFALVAGCKKKTTSADAVQTSPTEVEGNDLPSMRALLTTGVLFDFRSVDQQMIIILFQPGCDDCQIEAEQISKNIEAFKGYKLYFMSSHPIAELKKFAADYGLDNHPDVIFGQVAVDGVIQNFGQVHTPSVYIYSEKGEMIKSFNGKTDVNQIISALQK